MADLQQITRNARVTQLEINRLGFGIPERLKAVIKPKDVIDLYDYLVKSRQIRTVSRKLFLDGHYSRAVEEAYKCLNNYVKAKSRVYKDGHDLMCEVFNDKTPVLKLNKLKTQSDKDEQKGYMFIFAGCMTGIRNPRAHEHNLRDPSDATLEMLAWANHLIRVANKARRSGVPEKVKTAA